MVIGVGVPCALLMMRYVSERVQRVTIWDAPEWTVVHGIDSPTAAFLPQEPEHTDAAIETEEGIELKTVSLAPESEPPPPPGSPAAELGETLRALKLVVEDSDDDGSLDEQIIRFGAGGQPQVNARTPLPHAIVYFFRCMWRDYRVIFSNRSYMLLCTINLLVWIVVSVLQSLLLLYVKYVLMRPETEFNNTIVRVQAGIFSGLILIVILSPLIQVNKKLTMQLTVVTWAVACLCLIRLRQSDAVEVIFGVCMAVSMLMLQAMLPDVIDYGQLHSAHQVRQDASYYSFFTVFQKLGVGLALGVTNMALGAAGFTSNSHEHVQPPGVSNVLHNVFTILPPITLLLSLVPLHYYKITRERQAQYSQRIDTSVDL